MNIPEGWPTEEMLNAGLGAFWDEYGENISQIARPLEAAFEAMLAATPTPPAGYLVTSASGDTAFFEQLPEILPSGCLVQEQPAPPAQGNDWKQAVLNECMAIEGCYKESDPAGTVKCLIDWHVANERAAAQDEPVAWMDVRDNWDLYKNKPNQVDAIPLYTRPQPDKLREAAEEVLRWMVQPEFVTQLSRGQMAKKLRAALEEEK